MEYRKKRPAQNPQVKKKRVFTPADTGAEPASPQYTGHYAGLHGEDTPHVTTADVRSHLQTRNTRPAYESDELEAGSRIAAMMTQRYDGIAMPDGVMVRSGNDQVYFHKGPRPVIERAGRKQAQVPPPKQTDALPVQKQRKRFRPHWLFFIGLAFLAMVIGFVLFNAIGSWWNIHNNDTTYGTPRTYQTDAVVGHQDSAAHPSHFIAINLNRHVVIIEIPGGDISRSVIYSGGMLLGDGQDLTPVTLSFSDVNGDGRVDMIVHILDQTIVFLNNGTKFVSPSNLVNGGSNPPNQGE